MLEIIEEAVGEYWGDRCPDYDPECPTCMAWNEYDRAVDALDPNRVKIPTSMEEAAAMNLISEMYLKRNDNDTKQG